MSGTIRRGLSKAVSAMVAAALACSMVLASALASEQRSQTLALSRAAAAASQLDITVPIALDFSNGSPLYIEDAASLHSAVEMAHQEGSDRLGTLEGDDARGRHERQCW